MAREGFFVVVSKPELFDAGLRVVSMLRGQGEAADIDYRQRSFKAQMRAADKGGFKYAWIVQIDGGDENIFGTIRDLDTGEQQGGELA